MATPQQLQRLIYRGSAQVSRASGDSIASPRSETKVPSWPVVDMNGVGRTSTVGAPVEANSNSGIAPEVKESALSVVYRPVPPDIIEARNTALARRRVRPGDSVKNPRMPKGKKEKGKGGKRRGDVTVNVYDVAEKAYQMGKYILSLINVEQKFFDVTFNSTQNSTASVLNLTNLAQGNDYNQREGNSILTQELSLTGAVYINTSGVQTSVRVMVVVDHDQRGSDPAASDILETATAPLSVFSPVLHYTYKRFTIEFDQVFHLWQEKEIGNFAFSKKINFHVLYSATGAADASNWENAIYVLQLSNEATNAPTIQWYSRLKFTDN